MRSKVSVVLACAALFLGACSGAPATEAGNRTRLGDGNRSGAGGQGSKSKKVLDKAAKIGEKAEAAGAGGSTAQGSSARAAGQPPARSTKSEINPAFARRTAVIDDADNDSKREGITPAYAEIVKASIIGLGDDFKMTLTLADTVPQQMPNDKTHMIIAFGITGSNDQEGYSFGAQCTTESWDAYAGGRDDGNGEFPGTFEVKGNVIEMVVPWDYIQGPRAFEWYAASNWFSQLANQTHYRIDLAPNESLTKFPQ
ncbi:MAG: hypothetical protein QOG04_2357 [Actinomycetota bacterium]|jgi:hypothetical protein|nr:hypothetical protein [Actinomycetota bacterium]